MKDKPAILFIILSLFALIGAVSFGLLASVDFLQTSTLISWLPFPKLRPLHVSLAVAWIFAASTGGIYFFQKGNNKFKLIHFYLFAITGIAIIISYLAGFFGGREYWEFNPIFAIPIILCWFIFSLIFFKTLSFNVKALPVYIWMWSTGIVFFLLTFVESNLWLLSYFNENIIRDITVQWKSYGSLVGSWNMLVYGTALYLMEKTSGDNKYSQSNIAYAIFFLGLINLMFGWAHHIYFVPAAKWIRITGYAISMTELLLLGRIIWLWRKNLTGIKRNFHNLSYKFIAASDVWIFINIFAAIAISVPAINIYSHGTLITAAHAMGSTIGINTMILFASITFIAEKIERNRLMNKLKTINKGFFIANISLLFFFISLIVAGIVKGMKTHSGEFFTNFELMTAIKPYYITFIIAGSGLSCGILLVTIPLITVFIKHIITRNSGLQVNEKLTFEEKSELVNN